MGTGFTGLSNYIATHIPRDTQSERGYYNLFSCLLMISAPKDLRRKTHTKSLDGQKGTPDDRATNVLNFYTSQKESSFQMPTPETVHKVFNFFHQILQTWC